MQLNAAGSCEIHKLGPGQNAYKRVLPDSSTEVPDKTRREPPSRIQIQYPAPAVDGGRYAAKRCVGDSVTVSADIFRDGHDKLRAVVRFRGPGSKSWKESELLPIDADVDGVRWQGEFAVETQGSWQFQV